MKFFIQFSLFSINVRLGDYDLRQSDTCQGRQCGNPHRFNDIDELIPHEKFNHRAINRRNDIGLIRLRNAVKYNSKSIWFRINDFIQKFVFP